MAELLSAGVFIEEVPSNVQVVQGVSTSTMGIVGFTERGPENKPTLVTSYEEFTRLFGGLSANSIVPLSMAAYFSNGGSRAYVVRVVPGDAVAADARILSQETDQSIGTGDGATTVFSATASTTTLKVNSGASPIVPGSFTVKSRGAGTAVTGENLVARDGTTAVTGDGTKAAFEVRINPASLPAVEAPLLVVVPGTITVKWTSGTAAKSIAITSTTSPVVTATNAAGSSVTIDLRTGFASLSCDATEIPDAATNLTIDYTPAAATVSATDDGLGAISGTGLSGTLGYTDGSYSLTFTAAPHTGAPVIVTYQIQAWNLDPISKGAWGNDLRVVVKGNADNYDAATATYSKFDVQVQLKNSSGVFETKETYEELDFATATDPAFFVSVINDLSDLISVVDPGANEAPGDLQGVSRVQVIAGGDATAAGASILATLAGAPLAPRSISISWTDTTGAAKSVTDDGAGNLTGDIDTTGNNTIDYTTGVLDVKLSAAIQAGSLVTVTYRSAPVSAALNTDFSGGSDGTFDSTNYGASQFTAAGLKASSQGIYALDLVDDVLQVVVPDFAGSAAFDQALIDYAEGRTSLPAGGDRFVILAPPSGLSAQEAVDYVRYDVNRKSSYAAYYWPHLKVSDPLKANRPVVFPPLAHVAGVYARTDRSKNVGKAPAGTVDGALRFLVGLEVEPSQGDRDTVYPAKINPLISGPATGLAVWGARTISATSDFRYVNARRLFMFVEKSIFNSTHWINFENIGAALYSRIRAQIQGFLLSLYGEGYFAGTSPDQAFFVICDETNNPPEVQNQGRVIVDVGIAPNKPAEFVTFRMTQKSLT